MKQLELNCAQNNLSLSLLCMQKALLMSSRNIATQLTSNCIEVCLFNEFHIIVGLHGIFGLYCLCDIEILERNLYWHIISRRACFYMLVIVNLLE